MKRKFAFTIILMLLMSLTACNLPEKVEPTSMDESTVLTAVAGTIIAQEAGDTGNETSIDEEPQAPPPPSDTPQPQAPTATQEIPPTDTVAPPPTETPSITPSPTDSVPTVRVSVDTNCRIGPGTSYEKVGALLVGEKATIVAREDSGYYWIIQNPDKAGTCWLWGEYATISGNISGLPVMTPPPSPTPSPTLTPAQAFSVQFNNIHDCGGTAHITFYVTNSGSMPLESVEVVIVEIATTTTIVSGSTDFPFVSSANGCPNELGSLAPGAFGYLAVPAFVPINSGSHAATIYVCTADGLSGSCLLKDFSFTIP